MLNANPEKLEELKTALGKLPRVPLADLPTPLEPCPRLSRELGGPELWVKREDQTGLALGGNKTRMFEFVLGQAKADGVDTVVGGAAVQSNYCRQLAAACAKLGLECHLILRKIRGDKDDEIQGGLLLDLLCGAKVEIMGESDWQDQGQRIRDKARVLSAQGRKVHIARVGDESTLSLYACAYTGAALEMIEQADAAGLKIDEMWVCSSDSTQSGLALALKHVQAPVRLVGVPSIQDPITPGWTFEECIASVGNECAELLGIRTRLDPGEIISLTDYVGAGYGVLTEEAREAILLAGRCEGLLLDPVYSSKAMAGLIDHIRRAQIPSDRRVVFVHTGGIPALFAYADSLRLEGLLER